MSGLERIDSGVKAAINKLSAEVESVNQQPNKPTYKITLIIDEPANLDVGGENNFDGIHMICPPGKHPVTQGGVTVCVSD